MTVLATEVVRAARPPRQWYRDPISCLHSTLATLVLDAGSDPLAVLGLSFEFLYKPGDVRSEEFYFPCRFDDDLARSIAPYHPVSSEWWRATGEDPLAELAARIANGELPIVAVDNYHLPFRPAYHDVHAAHLVVVYGIDAGRREVSVSDAMPPAFQGEIADADLLRSWSSPNPRDDQDAFFSDARIDRRCLSVRFEAPVPPLDLDRLEHALRCNVERLAAGDEWSGLPGLRRYLDELVERAGAGERRPLEELYPFGWAMQAQAYLHGELLRARGADWSLPELREAGRVAESVAYAWTGLRMTGAHGLSAPAEAVPDLRRHAGRLRHRYEEALEAFEQAVEAL
jgi:Butirosin biosynthesis protein H, N-terminal